ncbi:MAG: ThuA domain-containing protein [Propionibacteriaceae bacterium]|nr:ThuA domain-containing protein [Propionibacteriaceae bacterium]
MRLTDALVVSGGSRFSDPWHPFADTSAALTATLRDRGCAVEVTDDADTRLATLASGRLPSLLVLNIGSHGPDRFSAPATEGLVSALQIGLPTLLVHSTLTAFPDWPLWHEIAGGGWTNGTTYHPEYGPGTALADPDHPVTAGLDQLAITDERYTRMWVDKASAVFLEHTEDGQRHPLAWTRTWGGSPIVADALGHDQNSYRAVGRAALLERELDWLSR